MRRYILYMSYVKHVQLLNTKKFTLGLITLELWYKNIWQQCCVSVTLQSVTSVNVLIVKS